MDALSNAFSAHDPLLSVSMCYQCKKCSSGCPVSFAMDVLPHQVMRLIQLQSFSQIKESKTIWTCASCLTCTTRCPNDIDIAGVMDEFRQKAIETGNVSDQYISSFHAVFLKAINRFGRVHELSMLGQYKLVTGKWFEDLGLGLALLVRGKLKLLPPRMKGLSEIRKLIKEAGIK